MATTYLERTQTAGNQRTFTWSVWVKRSQISDHHQAIISSGRYSADLMAQLYFNDADKLVWSWWSQGPAEVGALWTNRVFRDTSGWYHIVVSGDTTNATAGDRMKMYINGVEETSFSTDTNPSLNYDTGVNSSGVVMEIGNRHDSHATNMNFGGLISHLHLIDGTVYPASTFGSTDATTGEWKINTNPTVTYGTNGAFILKDGNSVTDQSGEGNNFTVGAGTLTNTEDNPSDVFCTMNPLDNYYPAGTFSNGNNTVTQVASKTSPNLGTIGVNKGKFYWEIKPTARSGAAQWIIGVASTQYTGNNQELGDKANDWGYDASSGSYRNNDANTSYGNSYDTNDIIGVALDLTNSKLYFSKNSVWQNSGDPTSGATGTGAISITAPASTPLGFYFPAVCYDAGSASTFSANFGNGYFGTTIISSEGTNASGIGKFEYDVPTGYTALSTKGLNS